MYARKWASNSPQVMANIPKDKQMPGLDLNADVQAGMKTLGIRWDAQEDCFTFEIHMDLTQQKYTKRELLRKVATLFDPLGLVAAVTISGRILLQQLWLQGLDWDDSIPGMLENKM